SGITMPEAVLRSSSRRLTMTRSCNGRSFMDSLLSVLVLPAFGPQPGNRASAGVLADSWHSPAATANNRGKRAIFQAPGGSLERITRLPLNSEAMGVIAYLQK